MPRQPRENPQGARPAVRSAGAQGGRAERPVAAVGRALAVLSCFAGAGAPVTLAEIAARTGLHKSTALRLLDSLVAAHYVLREITAFAAAYEASFSLADAVLPALREVVAFVGESAAFHVRQGDRRVCLYRVESSQVVRDAVRQGDVLPLDRGAGGRVLRAFGGARGVTYEAIRRDWGVALLGDRSAELAGVSAPVFGRDEELLGALTVTAPATRMSIGRARQLLPWLRQRAAALSRALGAGAELERRMRAGG